MTVEQYGRRSLVRISGIPEPEGECDTTDLVRKIISDIDPNYREEDVIISHRVGKLRPSVNGDRSKPRQIIARLSEPSVKLRILRCGKNLKKNENYKSVYANEDLTLLRCKILFHCRQLQKKKKISQLWTTNGKNCLIDRHEHFQDANTVTRFAQVVDKVDPSYETLQNSCSCITLLLMLTINIQFIIHCHCLVVYCFFYLFSSN